MTSYPLKIKNKFKEVRRFLNRHMNIVNEDVSGKEYSNKEWMLYHNYTDDDVHT